MVRLQMGFHLRLAARGYYVPSVVRCITTAVPGPSQENGAWLDLWAFAYVWNTHKSSQAPIGTDLHEDFKVPPGNHLEALIGNRSGQYSIRINDQWRVCFGWTDAGAENVEIVDYH